MDSKVELATVISSKVEVEVAIPISSKAGGGGHPISSNVGVGILISSKEGEVAMLY